MFRLAAAVVAAVLFVAACDAGPPSPSPAPASTAPSASGSPTASGPAASFERRRVDLGRPTFSEPTSITNPLFPISELTQVIHLGDEAGEPLRAEVTLLPFTRTIEWDGQPIETRASQYVAYLDGRILEVAIDYYAQADDSSVWYLGEDVDNYEDGVIADHDGTWLAGRDGPAGMIMPADPKAGDVYRPENIPDLVFEEVTVLAVDETADGPRGPVEGAILVEEHLMDATIEHKVFAPGYGEYQAQTPDELLTLALALPIDAQSEEALPGVQLLEIRSDALAVFDATPPDDATQIGAIVDGMTGAWRRIEVGGVPDLLAQQMTAALEALAGATDSGGAEEIPHAALDVAHACLDLELRFREPPSVDIDKLGVWARQVIVDAAAEDTTAVRGDVAVLETLVARLRYAAGPIGMEAIDARMKELKAAAEGEDVDAAAEHARALVEALLAIG